MSETTSRQVPESSTPDATASTPAPPSTAPPAPRPRARRAPRSSPQSEGPLELHDPQHERDPLWFKDAIIYEVHVRAFHDSNGDGIGDFEGLSQKLDYLQELGVTAIWLLPFCVSPGRDDGYDIADYHEINPAYGTLRDFRHFMREANERGLQVICELVLNHTSDQHPWFQRARHAPRGSELRDFYVWSDDPNRYGDARIIFKDFEPSNWTWDADAGAYYWHRFFSHQPDLNFDNPRVRRTMMQMIDFWLETGVAGLRLDAVPYLYEREATSCENLPETHQFLKDLRRHMDRRFAARMLLAEANQWPEDAAAYFGSGDECHMNFHFPLMPRMFMALHMEDRFPIIDILQQTPAIPENSQWALFLRNHDELTLEMVTDEERDYMNRVYAADPRARINLGIRRRLAPLLGNDRRKIELLNALLFSMPGSPVIYYGDEIGMGDNVFLGDRNGVRTPMQWSADRNAGFSRANPQQLYLPVITDPEYRYESINVETQLGNSNSLLWWMKNLIAVRKRSRALGRGSIEFLHPENRKVLAFVRHHEQEQVLVVANLSRYVQYVELDLSPWRGLLPREIFGRSSLPAIGELPYLLTLGPYAFYWLSLEPLVETSDAPGQPQPPAPPILRINGPWDELFEGKCLPAFEKMLREWIPTRRWYSGAARKIERISIRERIPLQHEGLRTVWLMLCAEYLDHEPEFYGLPLLWLSDEAAEPAATANPGLVLARLDTSEGSGLLCDATIEPRFLALILDALLRRRAFRGQAGRASARQTSAMADLLKSQPADSLPARIMRGDQRNPSINFGDRFMFKVFRKLEPGVNPGLELGQYLTEQARFPHTPPTLGHIQYDSTSAAEPLTLGILHGFVTNEGEAWSYVQDILDQFFDRLDAEGPGDRSPQLDRSVLDAAQEEPPAAALDLLGAWAERVRLLGQRTAEMHLALGGAASQNASRGTGTARSGAFAPEAFPPQYQRALAQSMRNRALEVIPLLRKQLRRLPESIREQARGLAEREGEVLACFQRITARRIQARRIRIHGNFHLGQLIFTGKDFIILDFEGDPSARSLSERRIKRSPLRDVASMLHSLHDATYTALCTRLREAPVQPTSAAYEPWGLYWCHWSSVVFLRAYLDGMRSSGLLPQTYDGTRVLLNAYLLDKAIYQLGYELNHRPESVEAPLKSIIGQLCLI